MARATEARTRQYEDINSLLKFDSSPFDPSETRPIALQTSTLPDRNLDQASGSAAAEPSREAAPDAFCRVPSDMPDATRDYAVPASLQPPEEAPMEPRRSHDPGYCRALPDYASGYGAMPEAAPSSDPQPATALPNST
jgi:hypothetical protein